jgi:hypothetical protein
VTVASLDPVQWQFVALAIVLVVFSYGFLVGVKV